MRYSLVFQGSYLTIYDSTYNLFCQALLTENHIFRPISGKIHNKNPAIREWRGFIYLTTNLNQQGDQ